MKRTIIYGFVLGALLVCFLSSCKQNPAIELMAPIGNMNPVEAMVSYGGHRPADGCGWLIVIDSKLHMPIGLSSEFKIDNLEVLITYELVGENFPCGWNIIGYPGIVINKMELR
ncbi:MAG: hypothetical protein JKY52_03830 [Flavobacteriales bacterium]|nr:hypothetical protein [Flavobacteriales bacterium]